MLYLYWNVISFWTLCWIHLSWTNCIKTITFYLLSRAYFCCYRWYRTPRDPYTVLNIKTTATKKEIKDAYIELSKKVSYQVALSWFQSYCALETQGKNSPKLWSVVKQRLKSHAKHFIITTTAPPLLHSMEYKTLS